MKHLTLLSLFLMIAVSGFGQAPTTNPTDPEARDSVNIIPIYGDTYTSITGINYDPNWGQSGHGQVNAAFDPGTGNPVLAYPNFNYQGTDFAGNAQNAAGMEFLHVDIWVPAGIDRMVKVSPINSGSGAGEFLLEVPVTPGAWNSVDLPKSDFTGMTWDNVIQLKFDGQFNGDGSANTTPFDVHVDNIFFWKNAVSETSVSTLSDLQVDGETIAGFDASIESYTYGLVAGTTTIPQITTATSTNANATVSITQASAIPGDAMVEVISEDETDTTTYTVSYAITSPAVAAPAPPARDSSNVISIYSNAYSSIALDALSAGFDDSDVTEVMIEGNSTLEIDFTNFVGIDFSSNKQDASAMTHFHMDFWTSGEDLTGKVFNSKFSQWGGTGGEVSAFELPINTGTTPAIESGKWVSIDVPISDWTNSPQTRDDIAQFLITSNLDLVYVDNIYLYNKADSTSDDSTGNVDGNLITNGDFELGDDGSWFGNALNIQTEGGNSFNFADVATAGNAFDVNLSNGVAITQDQTYILTFEASTSSGNTRSILAGIGLNEGDFAAATETVTLTEATQTFILELTASGFGSANSRVLFDMGAETGIVVIDNVFLAEKVETDGELLTNGNFELGDDGSWFGNALNIQTESGNSFNFADVATAGNAFDVNLSNGVEIIQDQTYILTFDASTSSGNTRSILAGIGLNEGDFAAATETVTLTENTQTFTLELTASGFGSSNSRVLFDMGAETGIVVIDNVSLKIKVDTGGELLTNGDFELGDDGSWFGNAFNIQTEGGNSFNFADVATAGNAFDVNLSNGVAITQDEKYILTFDASTSEGNTRTIVAGIGLNEGDFTAAIETINLTGTIQTFVLKLTATGFGSANSRVLFDMGADTGIVVIDNVSLIVDDGSMADPVPMVAAPAPPQRNAEDVISIYSDAYSNINVDTLSATFDDSFVDQIMIEGDNTLKIDFTNFVGIDFSGNKQDASEMTHFHLDFWTAEEDLVGKVFNLKFSQWGGTDGEVSAFELPLNTGTTPAVESGTWVSVDVEIADWSNAPQTRDDIAQFLITSNLDVVFVDNIYLYKGMPVSIEDPNDTPVAFALDQNYPNPFNPSTNISYSIPENGKVTLEVYNIQGQKVSTLVNEQKSAGSYSVTFDASNLASGVYMYRLISKNSVQVRKMLLIK
ncbi:MAG: T9SS type A sorting domain-containing protein [Balneola sp.]